MKKWFWHKKLGMIIGKLGVNPPFCSISNVQLCDEAVDSVDRKLQVGDYCLIKFIGITEPLVVTIIGLDAKNNYIYQSKDKTILKNISIDKSVIISNNMKYCNTPVKQNLIGAECNEELELFEKIGYFKIIEKIERDYNKYSISLNTFSMIHQIMFKDIYSWAGRLRSKVGEELVIGNRNYPTLEPLKVQEEISSYFNTLPSPLLKYTDKSKRDLARVLCDVHTKLAWIHPFIDGNGRTIRLFCQLIALQHNYILNWESVNGRNRSYYNYAIRCSLKNYPAKLIELIDKNLKPLNQ